MFKRKATNKKMSQRYFRYDDLYECWQYFWRQTLMGCSDMKQKTLLESLRDRQAKITDDWLTGNKEDE